MDFYDIYNKANPLTIVVVDDHELLLAGIQRQLSTNAAFKILGKGKNGKEAIDLVEYYQPNLLLCDIQMPVMDGIEATRIIKEKYPNTFVIMLSSFRDPENIRVALQAGADGFLAKDISAQELVDAIEKVITGERVFSQSILDILNSDLRRIEENRTETVSLTRREQEILNLVAQGKKSSEIAEELSISIRTVESHRYNIMQKVGVNNVVSLMLYSANLSKKSFMQ